MERRATGVLLLLIAVLASFAVPQLLRPGLAGRGSAEPLPEPPAVGACVALTPNELHVVDCAVEHSGEVFQRWLADDPARPPGNEATACGDPVVAYIAPALPALLDHWQATVAIDISLRVAPPAERAGSRGWSACVLQPIDHSQYSGTIANLAVDRRPARFGPCYLSPPITPVRCTSSHSGEQLAITTGYALPDGEPPTNAAEIPAPYIETLNQECFKIAQLMTGQEDPTYSSQLRVATSYSALPLSADGQQSGSAVFYQSSCSLVSDTHRLTGSVVGLGDAPLPFA